MVDDYFDQNKNENENIKIDVYRDLENGFTNNVSNKNDDTSLTSILEYISFQKLWESWSLWDIFNCENNKTSILKEKRFYINKNNCQVKCFDIPSHSDKYITEEEIKEILYNNIELNVWCGPYVIGPEIYNSDKLLAQYLYKCMKRKKVRFDV